MTEFNYSDINKLYSLSLLHIVSKVIAMAVELQLDQHLSENPRDIGSQTI
jgi:hypothetical protein